jgi:hypothetical protein
MDIAYTFLPSDAGLLLTMLASYALPFIVSFLKKASWTPSAKVALTVFVSLVLGLLSAYADGKLTEAPMSALTAAAIVFTAAQANYATWFKSLGLDDYFNPPVKEG